MDDVRMVTNAVIAELNALSRGMIEGDIPLDAVENGIELETPNFVLKLSIDRGLCEECELHPPIYEGTICNECNEDRIYRNKMEDLYF